MRVAICNFEQYLYSPGILRGSVNIKKRVVDISVDTKSIFLYVYHKIQVSEETTEYIPGPPPAPHRQFVLSPKYEEEGTPV